MKTNILTLISIFVLVLIPAVLLINQHLANKNGMKKIEEANPAIMRLLSLLFFVAFIVIAFQLTKLLFEYLYSVFKIVSSLESVIIVAIIGGVVSIVTLLISKIVDYLDKRRSYLSSKRERPYTKFIDAIFKYMEKRSDGENSEEELRKDLNSFQKELCLWGSPKVVEKYIDFKGNGHKDNNNILSSLEDILNEMRKDLGIKKVKKGDLLSVFINGFKRQK